MFRTVLSSAGRGASRRLRGAPPPGPPPDVPASSAGRGASRRLRGRVERPRGRVAGRLPRGVGRHGVYALRTGLRPALRTCVFRGAWGVTASTLSSAGNTRGLIEATDQPRRDDDSDMSSAGNTRGLIEARRPTIIDPAGRQSSAGNTRGLIEAATAARAGPPAASLPRGIPAASLKHIDALKGDDIADVFRGEYPRPH